MKFQLCVIVSLSCLVGEVWAQGDKEQETLSPATPVVVHPITIKIDLAKRSFVGTVVPSRRSVVGSAVDGRVIKLFVEDGDSVEDGQDGQAGDAGASQSVDDAMSSLGQPIAQLRTSTISIEIDAARAELELREQELEEANAGSSPEEIAQAEARLKAATAIMKFASTRFDRIKALRVSNTASQEQFEESQSLFLAAEQRQIEAQAEYELAVKGPRKEVKKQKLHRMKIALAEVNRLEDMREKYTIRAPFDGFVTVKHTEVGAWVSRGDPIVEIVQLDPIDIRVAVPETYITNVHVGNAADVTLESAAGNVIAGKVSRIIPSADRRSRTFPVIIRLANPLVNGEHAIKAGMLAHVSIRVGEKQSVLTVPKDALVLDRQTSVVMVIENNASTNNQDVARAVTVELGVAIGASIQVVDPTGSLREGQFVVTRGNERLHKKEPWSNVKIVEIERAITP